MIYLVSTKAQPHNNLAHLHFPFPELRFIVAIVHLWKWRVLHMQIGDGKYNLLRKLMTLQNRNNNNLTYFLFLSAQ